MPQPAEHIAQAEKNERLCDNLVGAEFNDWVVTALFYAALHYVNAYFAQQSNPVPSNHSVRNSQVAQTPELVEIEIHYRELYARSLDARYEIIVMQENEITKEKTERFDPIRAHIRALLGIF